MRKSNSHTDKEPVRPASQASAYTYAQSPRPHKYSIQLLLHFVLSLARSRYLFLSPRPLRQCAPVSWATYRRCIRMPIIHTYDAIHWYRSELRVVWVDFFCPSSRTHYYYYLYFFFIFTFTSSLQLPLTSSKYCLLYTRTMHTYSLCVYCVIVAVIVVVAVHRKWVYAFRLNIKIDDFGWTTTKNWKIL